MKSYYAKANGIFLEFAEIAWTTKIVERVVHTYPTRYMQLRLCILFYGVKGIKKSSLDFKDLAYWDLETITSMIHYIIHELHPTDVKVIFDLDENPEKGNNRLYRYQGDCHPLHHDSNNVLIVYCKRSDGE